MALFKTTLTIIRPGNQDIRGSGLVVAADQRKAKEVMKTELHAALLNFVTNTAGVVAANTMRLSLERYAHEYECKEVETAQVINFGWDTV